MRRHYDTFIPPQELPTAHLAEDPQRAYIVRTVGLKWCAKRSCDGAVIHESYDRGEVKNEARRRGYYFKY